VDALEQKLLDLAERGAKVKSAMEYRDWDTGARGFLSAAIDYTSAQSFWDAGGSGDAAWDYRITGQIGYLEGLALQQKYGVMSEPQTAQSGASAPLAQVRANSRVFLVHGHDDGAKDLVARFMDKLKIEAIILHEQPNEGRTIIEKFEAYSDVGFAVVLMTPDDIGASAASPDKLVKRARQNVVLELGYFTGKIGRNRVCALHKPGVEIPSDIHGVLYVELDNGGGWKTKLAQELVQAKFDIDLQGLLQG
jgi:predicted nucleotide-binding protein